MRQPKRTTRKQRLREKKQAERNAIPFVGTCSSCRGKGKKVLKVKNAQLCMDTCLPRALKRLGAATETPIEQAITAVGQ